MLRIGMHHPSFKGSLIVDTGIRKGQRSKETQDPGSGSLGRAGCTKVAESSWTWSHQELLADWMGKMIGGQKSG